MLTNWCHKMLDGFENVGNSFNEGPQLKDCGCDMMWCGHGYQMHTILSAWNYVQLKSLQKTAGPMQQWRQVKWLPGMAHFTPFFDRWK
jgi:hypothetical protein